MKLGKGLKAEWIGFKVQWFLSDDLGSLHVKTPLHTSDVWRGSKALIERDYFFISLYIEILYSLVCMSQAIFVSFSVICCSSGGCGELWSGSTASRHSEKHWSWQLLVHEQAAGRNTGLVTHIHHIKDLFQTVHVLVYWKWYPFRTTTPLLSLESRTKWKL